MKWTDYLAGAVFGRIIGVAGMLLFFFIRIVASGNFH